MKTGHSVQVSKKLAHKPLLETLQLTSLLAAMDMEELKQGYKRLQDAQINRQKVTPPMPTPMKVFILQQACLGDTTSTHKVCEIHKQLDLPTPPKVLPGTASPSFSETFRELSSCDRDNVERRHNAYSYFHELGKWGRGE